MLLRKTITWYISFINKLSAQLHLVARKKSCISLQSQRQERINCGTKASLSKVHYYGRGLAFSVLCCRALFIISLIVYMSQTECHLWSAKGLRALRAKNRPLWNWFIFSYFVAYVMQITKYRVKHVMAIQLEKSPRSKVCPTNAF